MTTTAVRVALRVRPLFKKQDGDDDEQSIISFVKDEPQIYIGNDNRSFTFDFVYSPSSTQEEIYESSITPLLERFTEGKNVTILAYGQTGSGKTYSMGTGLNSSSNPLDQGIIHRFAYSLFEQMNNSRSLRKNSSFQIYVSFLEIYNEDINDLLVPELRHHHHCPSTSNSSITSTGHDIHPTIREDLQGNIYWSGIKEEKVDTVDDLLGYLKKGIQCRTTGSTEMNSSSSRSHAIFSIVLKQQITNDDDDDDITSSVQNNIPVLNLEELPKTTSKNLVSKFHFVDLAGSERLKRTNALGDRQKEGIFINGGLLALGNVISALGDETARKKNQHVPYRDSKLTRLLQDSLGGNSHTLMLACVSPSISDYTETLNTLKYANRARNIQNRVEINQYFNEGSPEETHYLRTQVSRLKVQVAMLRDISGNQLYDNEIKMMREEMNGIKSFTQQITKELAEAQGERDALKLKLQQDDELPIQVHPLIQRYAQELQTLKLQVAETQSKLDAIHHNHVLDTTSSSSMTSKGREHTPSTTKSQPKVSSSMGYLDISKNLMFVDEDNNNNKKFPSSTSSRRLNSTNKKKPISHRMKSTHSSSLLKKKATHHHQNMDELLELLRKEYLLEEERSSHHFSREDNEKSTDETVLHPPHDNTMENLSFHEAEFNNEAFPNNQNIKNIMPDTPISPTHHSVLDEDELEALSVPSWSDAPLSQSFNGSTKRKSISLDSMWDDTDSSMTNSRVASTAAWTKPSSHQPAASSKSKDMRRQSRNLLKMLHQIQADLLVKHELVGQLERSEDQYTQMRVNYEERLNELKDHLLEIQKQRDAALTKSGTTIVPIATTTTTARPQSVLQIRERPQSVMQLRENRQAQDVRSQYEVKLKRLIAENQELRKKHTQSTQSTQTARAKAEGIIGRLRADIEALKMDKKQLNKGLKIEVDKAREAMANYEREILQLKRREAIAVDARKKLEETNEAQNQVLKKRTEETAAVNMQMRQLMNVLRRAANEGTFLNEASLERLLNDANNSNPLTSPSPKNNMRRPRGKSMGESSSIDY